MILDALLQFDSAKNLAVGVGTYTSNNTIDLGVTSGIPTSANGGGARDIGIGDDPAMKLMVLVTTTFTSGGAGTLQVAIAGAPDNGSGAPGTFTVFTETQAYALASLIAGARLFDNDMPRPPAGVAIPRFLELQYIVGTAAFTAGVIEALLVLDRIDQIEQTNAVMGGYPVGITVAN